MKDDDTSWRGLYRPEFSPGRNTRIIERMYETLMHTAGRAMSVKALMTSIGMSGSQGLTPLIRKLLTKNANRFEIKKELLNKHWVTMIYAKS